jgi:hypothetical protein
MTITRTTNEKGHGCDPVPFQNHTTNDLDYPTGQRPGKASAALKAQFARAGHIVHDGGNDDYIVVKADWHMSRHCCNLAALVTFGRQLGVFQ